MKIKLLGFIMLSLFAMSGCGPTIKMNQMKFDPKLDREILTGLCTREALLDGEYGSHFRSEYESYQLKQDVIARIKDVYKNEKLKIILGTWCHDSKEQVPRFYKVIDQVNISDKNIEIICVNRSKQAGDVVITDLNIDLVPTFILYKGKEEIGRIVETPQTSLEEDLLQLLTKTE